MPKTKRPLFSIAPDFQRPRNIDQWPATPQFDAGHLISSNRSWRSLWPQIDTVPCTRCNLCVLYCPDAAIVLDGEQLPKVDSDWCKGCGICAVECPKACIKMIPDGAERHA